MLTIAELTKAVDDYLAANPEPEKRDQITLMKAEGFSKQRKYEEAAPVYASLQDSKLSLEPQSGGALQARLVLHADARAGKGGQNLHRLPGRESAAQARAHSPRAARGGGAAGEKFPRRAEGF